MLQSSSMQTTVIVGLLSGDEDDVQYNNDDVVRVTEWREKKMF